MADQNEVDGAVLGRARRTTKIRLAENPNDAEELQNLRARAGRALQMMESKDLTAAEKRSATAAFKRWDKAVKEKVAEIRTFEFRFGSIGRKAVNDLVRAHPPTPEQALEWAKKHPEDPVLEYDPDEYPWRLVAAKMTGVVMPGDEEPSAPMSSEAVRRMFHESKAFTDPDLEIMFLTARSADDESSAVWIESLGKG